jgi:hypothetical protein
LINGTAQKAGPVADKWPLYADRKRNEIILS